MTATASSLPFPHAPDHPGAAAGPVGAAVGAVVGGLAGALGSGAAVAAVDQVDNDNTVTGVGTGATKDVEKTLGTDADVVVDNRGGSTTVSGSGT